MGSVVNLMKPDGKYIHDFAKEVEEMVVSGRHVRLTLVIVMVDDDLIARAHTVERLSGVLGALDLAGDIVKDDWQAHRIEE